jgi:hypothetical protein
MRADGTSPSDCSRRRPARKARVSASAVLALGRRLEALVLGHLVPLGLLLFLADLAHDLSHALDVGPFTFLAHHALPLPGEAGA